MAITTTWTVQNMQRTDADGGVFLVYWNCTAANDSPIYTAVEGGKLRCDPDPTSPDYIPYDNLTEADVLGWVYASLAVDGETPEEAKLRVEADRTAKVQAQIDRANTTSSGVPWDAAPPA